MSQPAETREFQAEVKQLLDLVIHSLYTNKDIFLRELISNSSDALDKLRFEALTDATLLPPEELHIRLEPNEAAHTLAIHDNGIGMSSEEVVKNLGTIAKSGTKEFIKTLQQQPNASDSPDLIGQFGVGFYASFMVADRVTVITRRAGEELATKWESAGDGSYMISDADRDSNGTTVLLHLKPADQEDGLQDYAQEWVIRQTVKQYSDFVAYPIRMSVKRKEIEKDEEGTPKEDGKEVTVFDDVVLNSMKAIWTRPKEEVTEDEYKEFYKHLSHDWNDPLTHVRVNMEGTFEAKALIYLPSKAPFDLYHRDAQRRGMQLYVRRVFIMDDCRDLLPDYLRFVKGVIDAEDLTLNVSRETLQHNRQIRAIRKFIVRRVLDTLKSLKNDDPEKYRTFFQEFGPVIKEGLLQVGEDHAPIQELLLFPSTHDRNTPTSLADYVSRMKEGQEHIYYLTGPSLGAVENSPHLEMFRKKGYEVLFCIDRVDEVWLQQPSDFQEKKFQSVGKGEVSLGDEDDKKKEEEAQQEQAERFKDVITALRVALQEDVKEVRLSHRLTESPACLVSDDSDMTPQLEALLRQSGQEVPKVKRILELNPDHPVMTKLQSLQEADANDPRLTEYADLLYGQAILAEGGTLPDPATFSKRVAELLVRAA